MGPWRRFYDCSPSGKISRYLYGISLNEKTLKLALVEGSEGKIGSVVEQAMLYCFRYDPSKRGYGFYAHNIMKASAGLTVLVLGFFLASNFRGSRKDQGVG